MDGQWLLERLQQQSWVAVTGTVWPQSLKYILSGPSRKRIDRPLTWAMLPSIILLCASCLSWKGVLLVHSSLKTHPSVLFMRVSMCKSWEPWRPTASYQTRWWLWLVTGQSCSPGGATCGQTNRGANQQTELYPNRSEKSRSLSVEKSVFSIFILPNATEISSVKNLSFVLAGSK